MLCLSEKVKRIQPRQTNLFSTASSTISRLSLLVHRQSVDEDTVAKHPCIEFDLVEIVSFVKFPFCPNQPYEAVANLVAREHLPEAPYRTLLFN